MENKCFIIECRTGCSCCSDQYNHYRGPYLTKDEAQLRIDRWKSGKDNPVASQYSKYGNYSIEEKDYEIIPGDRIIIGNTVHSLKFFRVNTDGTIAGDDWYSGSCW